jgi:hypothetical protein
MERSDSDWIRFHRIDPDITWHYSGAIRNINLVVNNPRTLESKAYSDKLPESNTL